MRTLAPYLAAAALALAAPTTPAPALAQGEVAPPLDDDRASPTRPAPRIRAGAWEFSFGGVFTNTNGVSHGSFDARAGTFVEAGDGLVGFETLLGWSHVEGDDIGDLQQWVTYQRPIAGDVAGSGPGGVWPYVGVGGGVSRAWIPGAPDTRWPVGAAVGARYLQGRRSAIRAEFRYRRYLGVRTGDYDQAGWFLDYSFFIRNDDRRP